MIIKTYLDKCNTIISGSNLNTGLNPIGELNFGQNVSRMIIHFPIDKITKLIEDKTCPNKDKFKHTLHMTNAGSIDLSEIHSIYESKISDGLKVRAASFDLIFFLLPTSFDEGKGFDGKNSFSNQGIPQRYLKENATNTTKVLSEDGSNWYQARNGFKWSDFSDDEIISSDGIYSNDFLSNEFEKYAANEESIIIGTQHFDIGVENINIDITDYINSLIDKKITNNGIGIAFAPMLERTIKDKYVNYVGFFGNHTDTFFEPHVDSLYEDFVCDDRQNFTFDTPNKLYLYVNVDGNLDNLDELPICKIDDKEYEVIQQSKGIYYANVLINSGKYSDITMLYDEWSNLKYKGELINVEQYFTASPSIRKIKIGNSIQTESRFLPNIYGIKNDEKLINSDGEIRKIIVECKVPYSSNKSANINNIKLRLYVKDGDSEITVIDWDNINLFNEENNYFLRIEDLLPNEYFIDIRVARNNEVITYKKLCKFEIVNDITKKYI